MRYFTTNHDGYLFWKFDEASETMWYTRQDPRWDNQVSWTKVEPDEIGRTPETLNDTADDSDPYQPGDSFFAYETDEHWNRL